jgi:hypothetical protein
MHYKRTFVAIALTLSTVACKTEVNGSCGNDLKGTVGQQGQTETGYWYMDINCPNGGTGVVKWDPDDGTPGDPPYSHYKPGDPYP